MRFFRVLRGKRGIGLIQILVGAFVASIISLGVAQMMQQARISQRRIGLMTTLAELQQRINTMILDQGAFGISINRNTGAPFTALQNGTAQASGGPVKIVLYDGSGDPASAFDLLDASAMTGNGFTEKGNKCTTFNANSGLGNDDCPISYRLLISWSCPSPAAPSCVDPQLTVAARLVFNPSTAPNRILQRFARLIQTGPANTTSPAMKYDVVVKRTASSIAREFKLGAYIPSGAGSCPPAPATPYSKGAGACSTASLTKHPIFPAQPWLVEYDPHGLVVANNAGVNGDFRFTEVGFYACSVKGYAFMTDAAQIAIYDATAGAAQGTASTFAGVGVGIGANSGTEALLRLDASLNVADTSHIYQIRQQCGNTAGGTCGMGFSKDTSVIYPNLSITCSKLDASF